MVLNSAELKSDLFWKWFSRPRQTDGMTVEDYYTQFGDWRHEMISLSLPANEDDYIHEFVANLNWDIRCRLYKYDSCRSRLSTAYHDARFEESMMIIEENLGQIKAHKVFDEMSNPENEENDQLQGAKDVSDDDIMVQINNSHTGAPSLRVLGYLEHEAFHMLNKSTWLVFTGLKSSPKELFSISTTERVDFSSQKVGILHMNRADELIPAEFVMVKAAYQVFDKMPQLNFVWPFEEIIGAKSYICLMDFVPKVFDPGDGIDLVATDCLRLNEMYSFGPKARDYKLDDGSGLNMILMLIIDPGGCFRPRKGCGSFKCCNELGYYCWVQNVAEPLIISDPLITHKEACNEWSELDVQKGEALISANPMAGYAIRFEGETYAITRATSAKNVMVDDALDSTTKSMQMDVHRGMFSRHNNQSSFLVENEWCLTDLSSHCKSNLVYTMCESLYSLNEMLVLVFDPGGCSFPCMDCRLLEYNEEHGELHFTTNAIDGPEIFYHAFDEDSANQFSKGIYILGLSMGLQSMDFSWVVFEEQFCEHKNAFIIQRNSQQALLYNMDKCNVVVTGLPMQRVLFYFAERALLPLAYTMHIKYTLHDSNILGYQNAAIQRITHRIFYLLDGFKHSQVLTQIFCVDELLLVDLNRDRLHTFMHAFRVETTMQEHVKFLLDGNGAGKVHEVFG